jgi:hypothetical protein
VGAHHQIVVLAEAGIAVQGALVGGRVRRVEARPRLGSGIRRDLAPVELDAQRVGAEQLDPVKRVDPLGDAGLHKRGVVLEDRPLALGGARPGGKREHGRDDRAGDAGYEPPHRTTATLENPSDVAALGAPLNAS